MNVKVDGRGKIRIDGERRFDQFQRAGGAPLRLARTGHPVIPGLGVHIGLGGDGQDHLVIRKGQGNGIHRVGEGVCLFVDDVLVADTVARVQRADQLCFLLTGRGNPRQRRVSCDACGGSAWGFIRNVDIAAKGQAFAPEAHGAFGIMFLRLAE